MLEVSIFAILALFMLGGSIAMITNKQTVFSAFGFLVTMIGLAGMFALLNAQFLSHFANTCLSRCSGCFKYVDHFNGECKRRKPAKRTQ